MAKKKSGEAQLVEFVPNTSINVELSQSDLISVIMNDQIEIWEKELEEANKKLSDFDASFKPDDIFLEGIKKIVREKTGAFGTVEIGVTPGYANFRNYGQYGHDTQVGTVVVTNGIKIHLSFNIPTSIVKDSMKAELKFIETKDEERNAIINDIVKLQENIDNQSRSESKIRASISKKILAQQGNENVIENLKAMRESIFSDKKLLK